jgi:hypothetical protein
MYHNLVLDCYWLGATLTYVSGTSDSFRKDSNYICGRRIVLNFKDNFALLLLLLLHVNKQKLNYYFYYNYYAVKPAR